MNLKRLYQRFKDWQRNPIRYVNQSQGSIHCANCGTEFSGNYCPICGQKAGVGRINWQTLRQGVMLLWGMDSRSLSYTLLQLLLRPGLLISDYISGRRQMSFPPVKMLVLVGVAFVMIKGLLNLLSPESAAPVVTVTGPDDAIFHFLKGVIEWIEANPGWAMLALNSSFIFPTWMTFHFAPRNNRHTLPEGFFIQVFISSLMLLLITISFLTTDWICCLIPVYYVITYHQLFGYSLWGTLWRMAVCGIEVILMLAMVIYWVVYLMGRINRTFAQGLLFVEVIVLIGVTVACIAHIINKHSKPPVH